MEEVPLCAAAAIHRGPSTAAILNSSTSQKPISRRSWDLGLVGSGCKVFLATRIYHEGGKNRVAANWKGKYPFRSSIAISSPFAVFSLHLISECAYKRAGHMGVMSTHAALTKAP